MAVTTEISAQTQAEFQNMNYDGSGILLPLFIAISEWQPEVGVKKWRCFSCTGTKYTDETYYTRWRGFWNNDTGEQITTNFILLCGNTTEGTIPSAAWLEEYLNARATGLSVNLTSLKEIKYAVVCAELTEEDIITLEDDEPLRVTIDLQYTPMA